MAADDAPPAAADESAPAASAAGATAAPSASIAKVLQSQGPVVTCVLLRHILPTGKDTKPHSFISKQIAESVAASALESLDGTKDGAAEAIKKSPSSTTPPPSPRNHRHHHSRQVLTELIDEIQLDTTPSAKGVQQILGGPFSFIGQYPTEGVMLMKRADQLEDVDRDLKDLSIQQLKALCMDNPDIDFDKQENNSTTPLERADLVETLRNAQLPINPHKLQPPFDKEVIRGDILVLKVAGADNDDDDDDEEEEDVDPQAAMAKAMAEFHAISDVSNEEFFLNYTKDEWVKFAIRTDVVAPTIEAPGDDDDDDEDNEDEDEDEADSDEEDDEEEDYEVGIEDLDEKEKPALLNLILGELLRKFRAEHGRGPDSEELLALRRQVAEKLGMHLEESGVPRQPPGEDSDDEKHEPSRKRVKFTGGDEDEAGEGHDPEDPDNDSKPAASGSSKGDGAKKYAAAE